MLPVFCLFRFVVVLLYFKAIWLFKKTYKVIQIDHIYEVLVLKGTVQSNVLGTSRICFCTLHPRRFRTRTVRPRMLYPYFFMYVTVLLNAYRARASRTPVSWFLRPHMFHPKGKGYVLKLLFPDFCVWKRSETFCKTHTQQNSTNPWISRPIALTEPSKTYGQLYPTELHQPMGL